VGITCLEISFHLAFCFMAKEDEVSFTRALQQLCGLLQDAEQVQIMVMDRDLAFMVVVIHVFSLIKCILCVWYI
jgi:hypothetical protein